MNENDVNVTIHTRAAETEAAIRAKLIEMGWTPPREDGATEGAYATEDMIRAHNEGLEKGKEQYRALAVELVEVLELARRTLAMAALEGDVTRRIDSALAAHKAGGGQP